MDKEETTKTKNQTKEETSQEEAAPETKTKKEQATTQQEAAPSAEEIINEKGETERLESLFEEENFSEEDLSGVSDEPETKKKEDEGEKEEGKTKTEKTQEPKKGQAKEKETEEESKPAEEESQKVKDKGSEDKPPKGFVPLAALRESRELITGLRDDLQTAQKEIAELKKGTATKKQTSEEEEFKILSDEEFDQLAEDDPMEALRYERKLRRFEQAQLIKLQQEEDVKKSASKNQELIDKAIQKVSEAIPEFFDETSNVSDEICGWVEKQGLNDKLISIISDPATLIWGPDEQKPVILGEGAADIVKILFKVKQEIDKADPEKLRAEIEKELREKLTKEISADVLKKVKSEGAKFVSLDETRGGETEVETTGSLLTEADYAKLDSKEREKLLGAGA